jgi:GTP pyrophosphokinase
MRLKNVSFDEFTISLQNRLQIKPNEESFCWKIYLCNSITIDRACRLRDWISSPKSTGYEALLDRNGAKRTMVSSPE